MNPAPDAVLHLDWYRCEFGALLILNEYLQWHLMGRGSCEGAD